MAAGTLDRKLRIGIVAGEASGDILGGRLMAAIRERAPDTEFTGVGGETMLAQGLKGLAPLDDLAVNGFKDPLLRLPSLVRLLRRLCRHFVSHRVDAVVGVDFNVFNLMMERRVRKHGIPTAHYVSPSVYFWRQGRVKRIAKAADVVLALFPFEPALYDERGGKAVFVGHPLADDIAPEDGTEEGRIRARGVLGLSDDRFVITLLPGSRASEIDFLGELFLDTALLLLDAFDNPLFLLPTPTRQVHDRVADTVAARQVGRTVDVRVVHGHSRTAIAAADLVLAKSGTATLETLLLRRPMVVAYRLGNLTAWVVRRLQKSAYVALPNILAGRELVPELLQEDAQPARLAKALVEQYERSQADDSYLRCCARWHDELRQGGAGKAADVVLSLVDR
ncbi:MAG: lipid-A-disaccharide synthase [Gammaproteobacteria bacterium]|nr:lipid-A-disaccharide synthase [Gammaproteobacteria bacterium]